VLNASDVGHRVVVRRYVGIGPEGRPQLTDLLGDLVALDDEHLVVRSRDGAEHAIDRSEVTAAKRIPPRPAKYSEIIALERIADAAWPAPFRERLGEWILRAADGWTSRANSVLPLGDPGRGLDEAIDRCEAWYSARGLPPRVTVPLPLRRDVSGILTVRGWRAQPPVLVQTATLSDVLAAPPAAQVGVALHQSPSPELLRVVAARKGGLPEAARHVLTAVPEVRFAEVRGEDGALFAVGRGAVVDNWLHLGLVEVDPSQRGRGLAGRVSCALATWAVRVGATRALLQVEEHNAGAVAVYARLGFTTHHLYVTWLRDGAVSPST
jgi:N-acetylglutamate synthase